MIKNVLYMRSGPYKPDINMYNMQELGVAKALLKRGISTDVMYYSDENKIETYREENGVKIRIIWEKGYKILRTGFYPRMLQKKILNKYDLIILTEFSQIMTYLVSKRHDRTVLYTGPYYNLFKIPFIEPIYDALFTNSIDRNVKKIFTKSELASDYMRNKGYHNIETLGVGLDTEKFEREKQVMTETNELANFMKTNHCLLYVGSLTDRKNFPFTLEVFERLLMNYNLDYKLIIIGDGDERYVNDCFSKISKSTKNNIIHKKKVPNAQLKYIYPNAEFFILPSKLEIFGMVMLEAMYFGCVVITSINGGSSTLIHNENNGIKIGEFNADIWAQRIADVIKQGKTEDIRKKAHETIVKEFLWDNLVNKIVESVMEMTV